MWFAWSAGFSLIFAFFNYFALGDRFWVNTGYNNAIKHSYSVQIPDDGEILTVQTNAIEEKSEEETGYVHLRETDFWTSAYYSIVTFTTLGFGDVIPDVDSIWAKLSVILEVIFGYLMLGGLISIFANKLARRND